MDDNFDIRQESVSSAERDFENALRPLRFGDFSGQLVAMYLFAQVSLRMPMLS